MSEVCRLCMGKRHVNQQIFGEGGIYYKIKACVPVRILESDSFPKKVCKACVSTIEDIYTYCQKAVSVQRQLSSGKVGSLRSSLSGENDGTKTLQFYIKEEPTEDAFGYTNNGVIVFKKQTEDCNKFANLTSKQTQTELRFTDLETTKKHDVNCAENIDLTNWNDDLQKSELKVKIEEVDSTDLLTNNDFDRSYSSDDDLTLSNILIKSTELKNESLESVRDKCREIDSILEGKKRHKRKKKDDVSVRKNERQRSGGRPKKCEFSKIKKEKVVSEKMSSKEKLANDGDKYFYPEGTAEELKKWQCLTCFAFVKSRPDLLQHYKEHLDNPSKFLPKTVESDQVSKPSDGAVDVPNDGNTNYTKGDGSGEAEAGIHYALINNTDFGDTTAYQCLKCLKMFLNKRAVTRHLICHDDSRPFPCNMCGRAYKRAYEILLHGRVHNGFKTLVCKHPACGYKTVYRGALHNHIKRHEAAGNFKYTCDVCHKGFDVLTWYNEHKNVHLGVRPFTCDVCGKGFVYSRYLTSHRKCVHPEAEEKSGKQLLHRCPSCPRQFPHWRRLRAHVKREHEPQRLPGESSGAAVLCDICGKGLSTKEHLKFHRRTHTGEKPFVCRTCGKGFVKKCNLTLHERVHSGEKPHVCSHCGKAFSQRSTLVIHERYHSGARPYVCSICNKGFVAKGLLSMHQKTCL